MGLGLDVIIRATANTNNRRSRPLPRFPGQTEQAQQATPHASGER